jgi:hypothetical protein
MDIHDFVVIHVDKSLNPILYDVDAVVVMYI